MRYKTEEDVKVKFLLPYLREKGYYQECMDFEVSIVVQEGRKSKTIWADILIYTSVNKSAPLIICETKAPTEILDRKVREQAISYARLLPRIAPLVLITNGSQVQVFHTLDKSRLSQLPPRNELDRDIVRFVINEDQRNALRLEAKHELFIIDDVKTFKSILKACHNEIRNNEGLDPTAAFDEMSKLMFCKLYEEKENPQGNRFRTSVFDDSMDRLHVNVVKRILEEAKKSEDYKGLFQQSDQINLKDRTVSKIVSLFEDYDLGLTAFDVKGEAFEYFLGDTFTGGLGEYFTPRNVVEFMVEAINPKIGERIIDPFCGTGGFLIYSFELVSEKIRLHEFSEDEKNKWRYQLSNQSLFGTDWKERTSQACKMNMRVHGDGSSGIFKHDGFTDVPGVIEEARFDICITNPPFGSIENDPDVLDHYELGRGRNSQARAILALERSLSLVKPGSFVGIVIIDGVLNNSSTKYVRDYLKRDAWIHGVISITSDTFAGYGAEAKTSILFMERKGTEEQSDAQNPVFMALAHNTGYAPNGDHIPGNALPDILMDFKTFRKKKKLLGQHDESWITEEVEDRLDAEFYAPIKVKVVNVKEIRSDVERLIKEIRKVYKSLDGMEAFFEKMKTHPIKLGELLDVVDEQVKLESDSLYRHLGVRNWGNGVYCREEKLGREVKSKSLKQVKTDWLIYNRLFAKNGSFAIVPEEYDSGVVSNEFPTFETKEGLKNGDLIKRFIVHSINSPQYLAVVEARSTGSTKKSRGRFKSELFLDMTIDFPISDDDIYIAVKYLDKAAEFRSHQTKLLDLSKTLREGAHLLLPKFV